MPLVIKGSGDFEPAPPGLHQAVCVDVVDMGIVETNYGPKSQVKIVWQTKARNKKGERYQIRGQYTQSLSEKSNLRRDLESWRGRPFSAQELMAFDVEKLIGANCQIQVAHRVSKQGRTYANAQSIVSAKGLEPLAPEEYTREPWASHAEVVEPITDEPVAYDDDQSDVPF